VLAELAGAAGHDALAECERVRRRICIEHVQRQTIANAAAMKGGVDDVLRRLKSTAADPDAAREHVLHATMLASLGARAQAHGTAS
jgi:hypothetical protein